VSLARLAQHLRVLMRRPSLTSVGGLVALVVACCYVYLLLGLAAKDATPLAASADQPDVASLEADSTPIATPTATRTPTPSGPTATPSRTPTYTPISYTPTPAFLVYTVSKGDTLSGIARRYGTTVSAIMELNSLRSDLLSVGQQLLIPGQRSAAGSVSTTVPLATSAAEAPTPTPSATATRSATVSVAASTPVPGAAQVAASSSGRGLVVAFYYAWYGLDQWAPGKVADIPLVPYASKDRSTMVRHVEQARGAGIDAFAVAWYGPQLQNNQTESNLRTMLDVSSERGFRVTVDFETRSPFYRSQADIVGALRNLIDVHAAHPAFLRYEGKPLIFFWAVRDVFKGQGQSAIEVWSSIRQQVDPQHNTLWIADGANIDFLRVFDGHHLYNITWNPPVSVSSTLNTWGDRVRAYAAENGSRKLWIATVMPGYNDLYIQGRSGRFAHDRRSGAYYRETWQAATDSKPDLVVITSFNEWLEGTQIEPSASYGNLYLDLTAELSAAYQRSQ
jgi:LysM repeat protein